MVRLILFCLFPGSGDKLLKVAGSQVEDAQKWTETDSVILKWNSLPTVIVISLFNLWHGRGNFFQPSYKVIVNWNL